MIMATSRFFVSNLAGNTSENDLVTLFQDYGKVERVELKNKENLTDPTQSKLIAFVTLQINEADVRYCINELSWQKLHGVKLNIAIAKESFLDRLKREREEAASNNAASNDQRIEEAVPAKVQSLQQQNKRKIFAEDIPLGDDADEDGGDGDETSGQLILKKRAANSMHNGQIVIQKDFDIQALHVIEGKKHAHKRRLEGKSESSADQKRKESMYKKKNEYQQKKSAIQQALAGRDTSKANINKIKFSDAESEDDNVPTTKSKTNIFAGDDDESNDEELNKIPQHFGKKGEKLVQLQNKQSLDPRFKIGAEFVDDGEDDDEDVEDNNNAQTVESERNWQMGILEQVVGSKINHSNSDAAKAGQNKKMLRFDPSKAEHQIFLRPQQQEVNGATTTDKEQTKKSKKQKAKAAEAITTDARVSKSASAVSKEVFYVVTDTLQQSLKTRGDGFSLLQMLGAEQTELERERELELKMVTNEKILVNKLDKNRESGEINPFSFDSSSDSDTNEVTNEMPVTVGDSKKRKQKLPLESFFIPKNDARLKAGANFFKHILNDADPENYEDVRNRLKMLIKTKITKSKKNLSARGVNKRKSNKKY